MLRNTLNTFMTAALIMLLGVSSSAQEEDPAPLPQMHPIVPAGSKIKSKSILELSDGTRLKQSVTVTVNLQRSQPQIALKAGPQPNRWLAGESDDDKTTKKLTYTYTITTTANGEADYSVSAEVVDKQGLEGTPSADVEGDTISLDTISLGATAAISNNGPVVTVPYDGAADNIINGISKNDIVVINGEPYEVKSLTDTAEDSTLTLDKDPRELLLGTLIAERGEFTVTLRDVVLAKDTRTNPTLRVTATQPEVDAPAQAPDQSFLVVALRAAEMLMYVRNLSEEAGMNPASDAGNSETYPQDGATYWDKDQVKANPGDTLEYLVMIRAGNDGPLTAGPYERPETSFLEYVAGTTALNKVPLTDEEITAGEGVTLKHEGAEGDTIDTNETAYVTYRMTVIGGVGDKPAIAATYTGCLIEDAEDRQKWCQPDGTLWADAPVLMRALVDHTACWRDITEDEGEWVVGANGFHENHQYQPIIREAATSKESQGYEDDNRYACQMKGMANYLIECFTDKRLTRRDCR